MDRFTISLTVLFTTFALGVAVYYFCYLPISPFENASPDHGLSSVDFVNVSEMPAVVPKDSDSYPVSACDDKNPYEHFRKEPKTRGIISIGVVNSRVLCGELPELAESAHENVSGVVTAHVLFDVTGKVAEVRVDNQPSAVRKAIVRAARQTRIQPVMLRGDIHVARGILMYEFDGERRSNTL